MHLEIFFEVHQEKQVIDAVNSGRFLKYINQKLGRPNNIDILKGKMFCRTRKKPTY